MKKSILKTAIQFTIITGVIITSIVITKTIVKNVKYLYGIESTKTNFTACLFDLIN